MADQKNGLVKNERKRMMMIVAGVLGVVAVGTAVWTLRQHAPSRPHGTGAQTQLAVAPDVKAVPGTSTSLEHQQLVNQANQMGASDAIATGNSFVPTPVAAPIATQRDPFDLAQEKAPVAASAPVATPRPVLQPARPAPIVATAPVQQAPQVSAEDRARITAKEQAMSEAMRKLLAGWTPAANQQLEANYTGAGKANASATGSGSTGGAAAQGARQTASNGTGATSQYTTAGNGKKVLIHAASITPAVLLTSINSDQPGPILAQIVAGPFEGARALGKFTKPQDSDTTVMQFSVLTTPGEDGVTLRINAFAVDPETARTGMASDVDHHYLSRYGLYFAALFAQGYGNALQTSGSTVSQSLVGSTASYPSINAAQKAYVALGQVGTGAAAQLQKNFNRQSTVTVNQGTPLGLLFMTDVTE